MVNIDAEEKMKKARIKLFSRSPFFSYLALFLKFREDVNGRLKISSNTMGVSVDGTLLYSAEWVNSLNNEECMGVICHEIMHLASLHLIRRGTRQHTKWNVATDFTINAMLHDNGFTLPKGGLIPTGYNSEFTIMGKKLENLNKKCAEEIYEELPDIPEMQRYSIQLGDGSGNKAEGFDEHIEGKIDGEGNEKDIGSGDKNKLEHDWLGRLEEAYVEAKSRGALPNGIERFVDELKKSQVNWRALLQKYLQALLPTDQTWLKRGKRSYASGFYLPSTEKEKIEVVVSIDTSGSIGKDELTEFVSEIVGIAKAYKDRLSMKVLIHDAEVNGCYDVKNGSIEKIKKVEIKGGGGTEFNCVVKYINSKLRSTSCLIWFTDGYGTEITEKANYPILWILSKNGSDELIKPRKEMCVKLKSY